ncbi:MAG: nitroreductase family protein [Alphaproteobacteria bacterium]
MDVFEAMETCRAIRFFKKDPVPQEMIDKIMYAATRAPSPGNTQGWDFIVVTDQETRSKLADGIAAVMRPAVAAATEQFGGADAIDPVQKRMLDGALNLAVHLADVPVHILVCGKAIYPPNAPSETFVWSALYPAAQNILVAARALGLGTCMTTYQQTCEPLIREVLNIPEDVHIACYLPLGWPDINFGPLARQPVENFVHNDGWQGDLRG